MARRSRLWAKPSTYPAGSDDWSGQPDQVESSTKRLVPEQPDPAEYLNDLFFKLDELNLRASQKVALTSMQNVALAKNLRAACACSFNYGGNGWTIANGVDDEMDFMIGGTLLKGDDNGDKCNAMAEAPDGSIHRFFTIASAIAPYRVKNTATAALTGLASFEGESAVRCGTDILVVGVASAAITVRKSAASATAYTSPAMPGSGTYDTAFTWHGYASPTKAIFLPRNAPVASKDFLVWTGAALAKGDTTGLAGYYCGAGYDEYLGEWVLCTIDATDAHFYTAADPTGTWTEVTSHGDLAHTADMDFTVVCGAWLLAAGDATLTAEFPKGAFSAPDTVLLYTLDQGTTWATGNTYLPARTSEPSRIRIVPSGDRVLIFHSDGVSMSGCLSG